MKERGLTPTPALDKKTFVPPMERQIKREQELMRQFIAALPQPPESLSWAEKKAWEEKNKTKIAERESAPTQPIESNKTFVRAWARY